MKILLNTTMNVRENPGLNSKIISTGIPGLQLEVLEITNNIDGYVWFKTSIGYIANVDEVYLHCETYNTDANKVKEKMIQWLKDSLESTTIAIEDTIKALEEI